MERLKDFASTKDVLAEEVAFPSAEELPPTEKPKK